MIAGRMAACATGLGWAEYVLSGEAVPADTRANVKSRPPFSLRRTVVLHLLLVVSLLVAQSAAFAHVSAHLKAPTDSSGVSGKSSPLCSECLESAPLLGAAGAPHVPSIVPLAATVVPIPILVCTPSEHRSHYAFRSRAPPRSL
jgi:hypothetical protein